MRELQTLSLRRRPRVQSRREPYPTRRRLPVRRTSPMLLSLHAISYEAASPAAAAIRLHSSRSHAAGGGRGNFEILQTLFMRNDLHRCVEQAERMAGRVKQTRGRSVVAGGWQQSCQPRSPTRLLHQRHPSQSRGAASSAAHPAVSAMWAADTRSSPRSRSFGRRVTPTMPTRRACSASPAIREGVRRRTQGRAPLGLRQHRERALAAGSVGGPPHPLAQIALMEDRMACDG